MTEMFQWPKGLSKKWPKCFSEKKKQLARSLLDWYPSCITLQTGQVDLGRDCSGRERFGGPRWRHKRAERRQDVESASDFARQASSPAACERSRKRRRRRRIEKSLSRLGLDDCGREKSFPDPFAREAQQRRRAEPVPWRLARARAHETLAWTRRRVVARHWRCQHKSFCGRWQRLGPGHVRPGQLRGRTHFERRGLVQPPHFTCRQREASKWPFDWRRPVGCARTERFSSAGMRRFPPRGMHHVSIGANCRFNAGWIASLKTIIFVACRKFMAWGMSLKKRLHAGKSVISVK